jgi:hypothetical protein
MPSMMVATTRRPVTWTSRVLCAYVMFHHYARCDQPTR